MLNFFKRFFDPSPPKKKSALTAQQACAIAEKAVAGTDFAGLMGVSRLLSQDGSLVWAIGSATMGSGMTVMIDDATGTVISCEQRHGR